MYRVYHLNVYKCSFSTRDEALEWILAQSHRFYEDYEILDGSDFL